MKIERKKLFIVVLFASVVWFWIAYNIPYTHDDWDWGCEIGLKHLLTADINSRYVGNLFEVIMTRSALLKTIILGCAYSAIPWISMKIIGKVSQTEDEDLNIVYYLAADLTMMIIDPLIWRQTFGWTAGAANYVISGVAVLGYCYYVCDFFLNEKEKKNSLFFLFFLFGIAVQLFLENISVAIMFSSFMLLIYCIKKKKRQISFIALFLGNIIGTIIMFTSPVYSILLHTGEAVEGIRSLPFELSESLCSQIQKCAINFFFKLLPNIWTGISIYPSVFIIAGFVLLSFSEKVFMKRKIIIGANLLLFVILCYIYPVTDNVIFSSIVSLCIFLIGIVDCIVLPFNKRKKRMLLSIWIFIPLMIIPLSVIEENGARLFFSSNMLLSLFFLCIVGELYIKVQKKYKFLILFIFSFAVIGVSIRWSVIYLQIGKAAETRIEKIEYAIENSEKEILIQQYPYPQYLWYPEPYSNKRTLYFKDFYNIPENVDVKIQPIDNNRQK